MNQSATRIFLFFALGVLLSAGCSTSSHSLAKVGVLSTPYHVEDFERLQVALNNDGIPYPGGSFSLGVGRFWIQGKNAKRARKVIERLIHDDSLTVRVTKNIDPQVYEVYESGKKVREESYVIK